MRGLSLSDRHTAARTTPGELGLLLYAVSQLRMEWWIDREKSVQL